MALLNQTVQVYGKLDEFFGKLREGQAPEKFTRQFLKDLGFKSSNWHSAISLLKGLGFLTADGTPTPKYMEFLDKTRWKIVLGEQVSEAYGDIFVMKREPQPADIPMIAGKFKTTFNMSETSADRAARTFMALYELSDKDAILGHTPTISAREEEVREEETPPPVAQEEQPPTVPTNEPVLPQIPAPVGLNYNIQIHLPATKDIEVYNAIFKSLREHIID